MVPREADQTASGFFQRNAMTNKDTDVINQRIAALEVEHRDLDDVILRLEEAV